MTLRDSMSKILYLDCFSGISGDMLLGALLDAGLPLAELERALGTLALDECVLSTERVSRAGVAATKFTVRDRNEAPTMAHEAPAQRHHHHDDRGHAHVHPHEHAATSAVTRHDSHHPHHRSLAEICAVIDRSALSASARERARLLFARLAEVEAAIHQMPVEQVHLHEVGTIDSIVDIVGAVFGLEWFAADRIVCSPLNVGGGMVDSAHGRFPVPAPATISLLRGIPVYSSGAQMELVTPTGALLASAYSNDFGPVPAMTIEAVGYGAGDRNPADTPNVLRVLVGSSTDSGATQRVMVLECEIDDMNPQIFGLMMDRLHEAGALDVYFSSVHMKKNRPGTLLTIVARPSDREALSSIVFRETTTLGLRSHEVDRERLDRDIITVQTPWGPIRTKVARRAGVPMNAAPEFEDCVRLSTQHGVPLKDIQAAAVKAYLDIKN